MLTYKNGGRSTQVDYILCRRGNLREDSDCKVVIGELTQTTLHGAGMRQTREKDMYRPAGKDVQQIKGIKDGKERC